MRTYGRVTDINGNKKWVVVQTDAKGHDDYVWVTTLCQCLRLAPGESPFYAKHGIPAQQSLTQQILPDFYVARTQRQFAPYFASLIVAKINAPNPTYNIQALTNAGVLIAVSIPT